MEDEFLPYTEDNGTPSIYELFGDAINIPEFFDRRERISELSIEYARDIPAALGEAVVELSAQFTYNEPKGSPALEIIVPSTDVILRGTPAVLQMGVLPPEDKFYGLVKAAADALNMVPVSIEMLKILRDAKSLLAGAVFAVIVSGKYPSVVDMALYSLAEATDDRQWTRLFDVDSAQVHVKDDYSYVDTTGWRVIYALRARVTAKSLLGFGEKLSELYTRDKHVSSFNSVYFPRYLGLMHAIVNAYAASEREGVISNGAAAFIVDMLSTDKMETDDEVWRRDFAKTDMPGVDDGAASSILLAYELCGLFFKYNVDTDAAEWFTGQGGDPDILADPKFSPEELNANVMKGVYARYKNLIDVKQDDLLSVLPENWITEIESAVTDKKTQKKMLYLAQIAVASLLVVYHKLNNAPIPILRRLVVRQDAQMRMDIAVAAYINGNIDALTAAQVIMSTSSILYGTGMTLVLATALLDQKSIVAAVPDNEQQGMLRKVWSKAKAWIESRITKIKGVAPSVPDDVKTIFQAFKWMWGAARTMYNWVLDFLPPEARGFADLAVKTEVLSYMAGFPFVGPLISVVLNAATGGVVESIVKFLPDKSQESARVVLTKSVLSGIGSFFISRTLGMSPEWSIGMGLLNTATTAISEKAREIKESFTAGVEVLGKAIASAKKWIGDKAVEGWSNVLQYVSQIPEIGVFIKDMMTKISSFISGFWEKIKQMARDAFGITADRDLADRLNLTDDDITMLRELRKGEVGPGYFGNTTMPIQGDEWVGKEN